MKTSMKLMVMTLVVAMLLSMSAFAATSVKYESFVPELNEAGTDYNVVVNYSATGYAAGDQVTMLVLVGSETIEWEDEAETIPSNVIYIDQQTISNEAAGETALDGSFEFTIAKSDVIAEVDGKEVGKDVYVKLGATSQTEADQGTYTEFVKTEGGDTVEVTVDKSVADAFKQDGLAMISITPVTPIADGKVMKVNGATMFYTLYNGVKRYTALLGDYNAETAKFTVEDGEETRLIYGNVTASDTKVDIEDVANVVQFMLDGSKANTDMLKLAGDLTGDAKIDIEDVANVVQIMLDATKIPPIIASFTE